MPNFMNTIDEESKLVQKKSSKFMLFTRNKIISFQILCPLSKTNQTINS